MVLQLSYKYHRSYFYCLNVIALRVRILTEGEKSKPCFATISQRHFENDPLKCYLLYKKKQKTNHCPRSSQPSLCIVHSLFRSPCWFCYKKRSVWVYVLDASFIKSLTVILYISILLKISLKCWYCHALYYIGSLESKHIKDLLSLYQPLRSSILNL